MNENKFIKGMFNVSNKPDTYREAVSLAILKVNPSTISLIKKGKSPKGDIIEAAKISATMAAKRTWDLIPYCHPIPIDQVLVEVFLRQDSIEIAVEVKSVWKTGVEMESLTGACIGALTIYDMLKPVDDTLSIGSVRLLSKSGGIKDFHEHGNKKIKAAVLVISDSVASGKRIDKSGKAIVDKLLKGGVEVIEYKILPDDIHLIEHHLKEFCDDSRADLILTSGGTGLGPRDVTPEATYKVLEKEVIGISETTRAYGQRRLPLSMLSRGLSGVRGKTLIINLPGSVRAVSESMDSLFPGILHAFRMLEGHGH
jgi:cyclic pyranopterin monophosphate synthase